MAAVTTAEQSLAGFLDSLASADPAPGGGAAAAVAAALAAGLVSMVGRLTKGADTGAIAAAIDRADSMRAALLALADDDAVAYLAVRAAYRLPRDEPTKREAAIEESLAHASAVARSTAATATSIVDLAQGTRPIANPNLVSDIDVAVLIAGAAAEAATLLAELGS